MNGSRMGNSDPSSAVPPDDLPAIVDIQQAISVITRRIRDQNLHVLVGERAGVKLSSPHYSVLTRVVKFGPVRVSDVAAQLGLDTSTMSRYVRALEQRGLVDKEPDPTDGRSFRITTTPDGEKMWDLLFEEWIRTIFDMLADWDSDAIRLLADQLSLFAAVVDRFDVPDHWT